MPRIELVTTIRAPIERIFDLARSIDLHSASMSDTGEQAISGVTHGLIAAGETVTWRARHFGVWQTLTSEITRCDRPHHFSDRMVKGAFRRFDHDHVFAQSGETTVMTDVFDFTAPLGLLGHIANALFLERYMRALLMKRNDVLRVTAESELWRQYLPQP